MSAGGGGAGGQIFSIGKSKAKLFDEKSDIKVTFKDVAGLEGAKEEVQEIVDFLKNPQKYASSRISDTMIDFVDFKYRGKYDFSQLNDNKVKFIETFTDDLTKNVRQQETQYTYLLESFCPGNSGYSLSSGAGAAASAIITN